MKEHRRVLDGADGMLKLAAEIELTEKEKVIQCLLKLVIIVLQKIAERTNLKTQTPTCRGQEAQDMLQE